jgi:hypothetical protein
MPGTPRNKVENRRLTTEALSRLAILLPDAGVAVDRAVGRGHRAAMTKKLGSGHGGLVGLVGGANQNRTGDLLNAMRMLGPTCG